MTVDAVLIQRPAIDFSSFLGIAQQALGRSPASRCDASHKQLHDAERFISCLQALNDPQAAPGLHPQLLSFVSFTVLVAADERDALEILESAKGMPFISTPTRARGIVLLVVTGTLDQWRAAVIYGSQKMGAVQACYCKILTLFEQEGLSVWKDCHRKQASDPRLFYLEDKR